MKKEKLDKINKLGMINYKLGIGLFILNCLDSCFLYFGGSADERGFFLLTLAPMYIVFNSLLLYMASLENAGVIEKDLSYFSKASKINLFLLFFALLLLPDATLIGFIYGLIGSLLYLVVFGSSVWSLFLIGKHGKKKIINSNKTTNTKKYFWKSVGVSLTFYIILYLLFNI